MGELLYVHEIMQRTTDGATQKRRRMVVLSLPTDRGVRRTEIRRLTPELAEMYAGSTDKTLSRDVNRLHELGLIQRQGNLWWSRIDLMYAFMSITRNRP
ncbi:MAG: hypothetical protein ACRDT0_09985 [Pseudonocardiaceae bacterium]